MKITLADLRALQFCNRGARQFCARHGINWQLLVTQGIDISEFDHIDDAMLKQVIAHVQRREGAVNE